jgi:hypothetical protein
MGEIKFSSYLRAGGYRRNQECERQFSLTASNEAGDNIGILNGYARPEMIALAEAAPALLSIARKCEAVLAKQGWLPDGTDPESGLLREAREAIALAKPATPNEFTPNPARRIDGEIDEYLR